MMKSILCVLLSLHPAQRGGAAFIDNTAPRVDVAGQLMDVHDGNVLLHEGVWHWFGMGYRDCELETGLIPPRYCPGIYRWGGAGTRGAAVQCVCREFGHCGFRTDHAINLYTSPDLETWTFVGDILPPDSRPEGIYFRPKVLHNAATGEWVLWVNHLAPAISPLVSYPHAGFLVAASATPAGPYTVVTERASVEVSGGGDFAVMVDPADEEVMWGSSVPGTAN